MSDRWVVHKFGGTSLADADGFRRAATIVGGAAAPRAAIVVSAPARVTDALLRLIELAAARDPRTDDELERLQARILEIASGLLRDGEEHPVARAVVGDAGEIGELLRAIRLTRSASPGIADLVSGYGELWSAQLLAAHLVDLGRDACWLDAREVLVVEPGETAPRVDREATRERLSRWLGGLAEAGPLVITGFVARTATGVPTTLGRNGSDHSASIFGALLGARSIEIWTDVDGVMSADPNRVAEARILPRLSYDEAMELAYFGAKVLHPQTMAPAVEAGIPIRIRNSFDVAAAGTTISALSGTETAVKGFATIDRMALINLEGSGLIGVPGIAERVFGALRQAGVSVVLISQGSSEHSICFAVPQHEADAACRAVERAFYAERHQGRVRPPEVTRGCAILAAVGDGMAGRPGVAGRFFGALARAGVNVRAIAQGSSERNISAVIDAAQGTRALRSVHAGFYLSNQTLSIGIVGSGLVGSTLIEQLRRQAARLREDFRTDLRIRAVADSSRMLLDGRELALGDWRERLVREGQPVDLDRFACHVQTDSIPHAALVDCTASPRVAARYADLLERGIHVVTPNKLAHTAPMADFRRLRAAVGASGRHYLYETTVGAGLPILQTLRELIRTGDEIVGIEGILSGTLSYLFNAYDGTRPFSAIVAEARTSGYTEPDPREDLSGRDVARKLLILAREMGLDLELERIETESLVPPELRGGSVDEFMERLTALDGPMAARREAAARDGEVLRFVGRVAPDGAASVRLARVPREHPFAAIRQTDNVVLFRTRRYSRSPLVVQGPGAGPEVTAAGVFADLLRLAAYLGGSA